MIVNVNPYDTGFDENSHVMKFSALAREVILVSKQTPAMSKDDRRRTVTLQMSGKGGRGAKNAHVEVVEG